MNVCKRCSRLFKEDDIVEYLLHIQEENTELLLEMSKRLANLEEKMNSFFEEFEDEEQILQMQDDQEQKLLQTRNTFLDNLEEDEIIKDNNNNGNDRNNINSLVLSKIQEGLSEKID